MMYSKTVTCTKYSVLGFRSWMIFSYCDNVHRDIETVRNEKSRIPYLQKISVLIVSHIILSGLSGSLEKSATHYEHPLLPTHWNGSTGEASIKTDNNCIECKFEHKYRIILPNKPTPPWRGVFSCTVNHNEEKIPGQYMLHLDNIQEIILVGKISIKQPQDDESRELNLDFNVVNLFLGLQ